MYQKDGFEASWKRPDADRFGQKARAGYGQPGNPPLLMDGAV